MTQPISGPYRTSLEFLVGKFQQADGSLVWSKPGRGTTQWATDASGNLYFAGGFNGANVDFDPTDGPDPTPLTGDTLTSNGGDAYVVKWDSQGNFESHGMAAAIYTQRRLGQHSEPRKSPAVT